MSRTKGRISDADMVTVVSGTKNKPIPNPMITLGKRMAEKSACRLKRDMRCMA